MTDDEGNAYLEFVINQEIAENDGKLYIKEVSAPAGNVSDDTVYEVRADAVSYTHLDVYKRQE